MNCPNPLRIKAARGFSLIELLVVITVIAILTALTMGVMGFANKFAAKRECETQIALLENAIEQYHGDVGVYPEGNNSLVLYRALFGDGVGDDGVVGTDDDGEPDGVPDEGATVYLPQLNPRTNEKKMVKLSGGRPVGLIDPWESEFLYVGGDEYKEQMNNPDFDLSSKGPDRKNSTREEQGDDLDNW